MGKTLLGQDAPGSYLPTAAEVIAYLQRTAVVGETERFLQLDRYEAHYRCKQYDHQEFDWWGKPAELSEIISPKAVTVPGFVPAGGADNLTVRERRPTAPKNTVKAVVDKYTGLLFSDKRVPRVSVANDTDTEAMLRAIAEEAGFWQRMRAARMLGGAIGSVLVTVHLRDGEFAYEVHNTKHCSVVWKDRRTWKPLGVLKMYKHTEVEEITDPKSGTIVGTREVDYLYRRIITDTVDCVFKPLKLEPGAPLTWEPDPRLSVTHQLGYFPGVWIQNTEDSEDMDGDPDCYGAYQTCDTLDRLLSQMNKGTLNNLDPTPYIGVDELEVGVVGGMRKGSDNALYVGKSGKVGYLEMAGTGVKIGIEMMNELKQTITDLTGYVFADPEKLSGSAQSGKALEMIMEPMTERADDFRGQYGKGVRDLFRITEKMARGFLSQPPVPLPPAEDGTPRVGKYTLKLPPRQTETDMGDGTYDVQAQPHQLGPGGFITIKWGPYFAPTPQDENQRVQNAVAAKTGGLIRQRTAIKAVADIFGVDDVDAEMRAAQQEQKDQTAQMLGDGGLPFGGGHDQLPPGEDGPAGALGPMTGDEGEGERGPGALEGGKP